MLSAELQVAVYARVSSEQQVQQQTINSQIAALRARVQQDGCLLAEENVFLDDGYSGTTLLRPALERLRDLIAIGGVDRLYVPCPDRLARKYAYQVLLLEEFAQAQVEVVFLDHPPGASPEEQLLVQVQGMVAEYERAKLLERCRRGRRQGAQAGHVSILARAPFGYRYVRKQEGAGEARFEVLEEEAQVVRQVFTWVGMQRATIGEVTRRLSQAKQPNRNGTPFWSRSVVAWMLHNPTYKGEAAYGRTRVVPLLARLRPQKNGTLTPRQASSTIRVEQTEWISIPVPALVSEQLFDAVAEQLAENQAHARQNQRGARYLLQGLTVCQACGYAFYGSRQTARRKNGKTFEYAYYRCLGTDAYRFGGERVCFAKAVRTDLLEIAVWEQVCALLADPGRLEQEYQRRLQGPDTPYQQKTHRVEAMAKKLRQGVARLIDSYAEGVIEKGEFEPRVRRLRERIAALETEAQGLEAQALVQADLRLVVGRLEDFARQVQSGLADADWQKRREIIRALVKRVEVGAEAVSVVFRVGPSPFVAGPDKGTSLPLCTSRLVNFPGMHEAAVEDAHRDGGDPDNPVLAVEQDHHEMLPICSLQVVREELSGHCGTGDHGPLR